MNSALSTVAKTLGQEAIPWHQGTHVSKPTQLRKILGKDVDAANASIY